MGKLVIDASLWDQLRKAKEEVELLDDQGRPAGVFVPPELYRKLMYAWCKAEFAKDEEGIQQARQESGGITTAELLERLRGIDEKYHQCTGKG